MRLKNWWLHQNITIAGIVNIKGVPSKPYIINVINSENKVAQYLININNVRVDQLKLAMIVETSPMSEAEKSQATANKLR